MHHNSLTSYSKSIWKLQWSSSISTNENLHLIGCMSKHRRKVHFVTTFSRFVFDNVRWLFCKNCGFTFLFCKIFLKIGFQLKIYAIAGDCGQMVFHNIEVIEMDLYAELVVICPGISEGRSLQ